MGNKAKLTKTTDGVVYTRNLLEIKGKKDKKRRHPAGGYYWKPDWPQGTPKKYTPYKPPVRLS